MKLRECNEHCNRQLWRKSWTNLLVAGCVFPCVCSPLVLSLRCPQKPDLPCRQKASCYPEKKKTNERWKHSKVGPRKFCIRFQSNTIYLTCDWPGLRGGDRSWSESFPLRGRLLGGDWSESEPRLVFGCLLGGDWSESDASLFDGLFRGGDWSESESCLFWDLFVSGDRSGDRFLLDNDELGFFLLGDESDREINW